MRLSKSLSQNLEFGGCPDDSEPMRDIFPPGCLARSLTPRPPLPLGEGVVGGEGAREATGRENIAHRFGHRPDIPEFGHARTRHEHDFLRTASTDGLRSSVDFGTGST